MNFKNIKHIVRKVINESYDEHEYYDFINEYSEYYVYNEFKYGNEKLFETYNLIKPKEYQNVLNEFMKFGKFIRNREYRKKQIISWFNIIMRNTAILRSCTSIAGHSRYMDTDAFIDCFFDDDEEKFQEYKNEINEESDYSAIWEFLSTVKNNNGQTFEEWMVLPDGSDAISDFGLEPIEKLIFQYNEDLEPEQMIVLLNKILDVIHCRGDLASMFIQGGKYTLLNISNGKLIENIVRQVINETDTYKNQLCESLTNVIYHFTSLENLYQISRDNTFYLQSSFYSKSDDMDNKNKFFISFTRQVNGNLGYSNNKNVRIELDGEKLNNNFKGKAVNYWGDWGKHGYFNNPTDNKIDKYQSMTENEDRLFSNIPYIKNFLDYIKRIDVLIDTSKKQDMLYAYKILNSYYSRNLYFYNNKESFTMRNNDIITEKLKDFFHKNYSDYIDNGINASYDNYRNSERIISNVTNIISSFLYIDNIPHKDIYPYVGKLLKKYNLNMYTRDIIKEINMFNYKFHISELNSSIIELREEDKNIYSQISIMIKDFFNKHNFRNTNDILKFINNRKNNKIIFEKIDKNKTINLLYSNQYETRYIYLHPEKISFWKMFPDSKQYFVKNIAPYVASHNSKDDISFEKYLTHLTKIDISLKDMLDIIYKLDIDKNYIFNIITNDTEFGYKDFHYDDYLNYNIYDGNSDTFLKLFYKTNE